MNKPALILTHEFFPFQGGVATYCLELALAAGGIGREVEVWAAGSEAVGIRRDVRVKWLGVGTRLHPWHLGRFAWAIWKRRLELRDRRVVLASVGAQMAWMMASRLGKIETGGLVVLLHGSEILKYVRRFWWRSWARELVEGADRVACVSEAVAELGGKSFLSLQSVTLAPGAPGSGIRVLASEGRWKREADGVVRILTLARLHPRKGQLEVAKALGLLPEEVKRKIEYRLAGSGDDGYSSVVKRALDGSGVSWRDYGSVSDELAAELYGTSDLYVMASRTRPDSIEGLGITYLEAALFGCPSVGFDSGGTREAVIHEQTGLIVPEGDIGGLAATLERLCRDGELRRVLGAEAKRQVGRFSWVETARKLLN